MATLPRSDTEERRFLEAEDYLNDKIQTLADLDNIDALLLSVKDQQDLLRKQLEETESILEKSKNAVGEHKSLLIEKAEAFQKRQGDIDQRLLKITHSSDSDEAIAQFEESMKRLQHFDIATAYFELLRQVDELSNQARELIKNSPEAALKPYARLQAISTALRALQPAAEGAAPHLVDHVEKACRALWNHMKDSLSSDFEQTLKKMDWPTKKMALRSELVLEWEAGVKKLLRLQQPELEARAELIKGRAEDQKPTVLLPLEIMARPLDLRFRYHFEGERPTNRPDKPEYFMSHIIDLLNNYSPFLRKYLQPVLYEHFRGPKFEVDPSFLDALFAFITALLPMLRRKVFALLPQIQGQPQLLSHLIHELINFDTTLRDQWGYHTVHEDVTWKGLVWEVLVEQNWFGKWLQVERDFALARYQDIIGAKDGGEIDYDSVEAGRTKPTKAAIRVNDLLESITDRYRPLASFSQKLRFLIDIQLAIFDKYHTRLQSGVEAYLAATSAVVRAVQGTMGEATSSVEGVKGLERLCRIHGSADYLVQALQDWSDDVFFLELWDELQTRARRNKGENLAGPLTTQDVAAHTSSAVGSDGDSGALFDETAAAYRRLRTRTEEMIIDLLNKTVRDPLKTYSRINSWPLLDAGPSSGTESISAELEGVLQPLDTCLSYLSRVLSRATLRHVGRQLSLFVQTYLWDSVLMRHTFSYNGALQFCADLTAIWRIIDNHLGAGQGEIGMKKLNEAAVLLSLGNEANADAQLGFHEAEEEIFVSNEGARAALEKLGLLVLSETEARHILERRVDVAG